MVATDLYPEIILNEDQSPREFSDGIDEICNEIRDARSGGFGTDEDRLVDAVAKDSETRTEVCLRYPQIYDDGKGDLCEFVSGGTGGSFGVAMELLTVPPDEMEARLLTMATRGEKAGSKETLVCSILCGRTNRDMECLKKAYRKCAGTNLGGLVTSKIGGDLEDFLVMCLRGTEEYDADVYTDAKAEEDVTAFYEAEQGGWGTGENSIFKIVCCSPLEHLEKVNELYVNKYGIALCVAVEKETNGTVKDALVFALGMKLKPYETVAKLIEKACKGKSRNELLLTSAILRYHKILPNACECHNALYDMSVSDRIERETRGCYRKVLLAMYYNSFQCDVVFENHGTSAIHVYWIREEDDDDGEAGEEVDTDVIEPDDEISQTTYSGHTFVFRLEDTDEEVYRHTIDPLDGKRQCHVVYTDEDDEDL